jgi:hypothetical protein
VAHCQRCVLQIKLLEPEDEVDQQQPMDRQRQPAPPLRLPHMEQASFRAPATMRSSFTPAITHSAARVSAQHAPEAAPLNGELYAPSCVLPDLSSVIGASATLSGEPAMSMASCEHGPAAGDGAAALARRSLSTSTYGSCAFPSAARTFAASFSAAMPAAASPRAAAAAMQTQPVVQRHIAVSKATTGGTADERSRESALDRFSFPHASGSWTQMHRVDLPSESNAPCSVLAYPVPSLAVQRSTAQAPFARKRPRAGKQD